MDMTKRINIPKIKQFINPRTLYRQEAWRFFIWLGIFEINGAMRSVYIPADNDFFPSLRSLWQ